MHETHLVNGIRLHSIRAAEAVLEVEQIDDSQKALDDITERLDAIAKLADQITAMRQPVSEETAQFKPYIERTSHVALPTAVQVMAFAKALDEKDDEKVYRGEYFHGYHFFVDPSAGQEEYFYDMEEVTRISRKGGNPVKREEYLSRFGYVEFWPIVRSRKIAEPEAIVEDRRMSKSGIEKKDLFVHVPAEITSLASLVSYETPLFSESGLKSNSRRGAFAEQVQKMLEIVRQGREKYCS